jgi:hypothetical protein
MMGHRGDQEFVELLRHLGVYQTQINAELAKGAKADQAKIAAAFAAGREFATAAAPYCHAAGDGCGNDLSRSATWR